ncbi:S8 family peptidase [Undibacterium sp. TJN25]|uniref:S8 family peptidase n=1 Tax=Undibacterium sp. TJN25 TaxID=3413056 RepID=UPI003BEFBF36
MIRILISLVVLCGLAFSGLPACSAADVEPAVPAAVASSVDAADAEQGPSQVLVMLHLPPPHFRPDANYGGRYSDDSSRSARRRIAEDLAHLHGLTVLDAWPMAILGIDCYVMEVPAGETTAHVIEQLSRDARVEWVQAMESFHVLQGSDPLYPVQPGGKEWHLAEVHQTVTGKNIKVAVIDSGVEENHPDLKGQVQLRENFVDGNPYAAETHGTAVAGIIAARAGNGIGIAGVAPGARLMALRACWEEGGKADKATRCNSFTLGKAINFAILHDAQVINLSLSGPPDRLLQRLLDAALSRGIAIVGAVDPHVAGGGFPASYPGVVAVSDDTVKDGKSKVLLAPGRDIPTTVPGSKWRFVSGSSYAAAHVSGMLALLLELRPVNIAGHGQNELLVNVISTSGVADARTAGVIDLCATITQASGKCLCSCSSTHASKANHSL